MSVPNTTAPLTFCTWKWKGIDPARQFPAEAVNVLYAMLARHYQAPFRLVCITDDPSGIDSAVDVQPLPQTKADALQAPFHDRKLWPSCFRRLWLFSKDAQALGKRICNIDLDVVICQDITTLLTSRQADFVGWAENRFSWNKVAGGIWLLNTGTHTGVWERFDPETSPKVAWDQGHRGSDQAWMSHCLYPPVQRFSSKDGLYKMAWLPKGGQPPGPEVKMIFTTGVSAPWLEKTQLGHRWVRDHWRL